MAEELTYVLITPYSLLKSRTGGIIGRLLSLADLELVAAWMYAPSDSFVDQYCQTIAERDDMPASIREGLLSYLNEYFRASNKLGIPNRTVMLLFRGDNAVRVMKEQVIGPLVNPTGDTVRGTYGDFIGYHSGELKYFEPAVLTATDDEMNRKQLRLLANYAQTDGGIVDHTITFDPHVEPETTLVILKPDNFLKMSSRPGNIIDMFSRTGLYIVAAKVLHMSVAQAEEFYGPLRQIFVERLKPAVADKLQELTHGAFEFDVGDDCFLSMADCLKELHAEKEFNRIVEYMTGIDRSKVTDPAQKRRAGRMKCLALLYHGENAVEKIRKSLGSTDPAEAEPGTVRSVYGADLMRNGAHASDSVASAERERRIVGLWGKHPRCKAEQLIEEYLAGPGG